MALTFSATSFILLMSISAAAQAPFTYPPAHRDDTVDTLHGVAVPDPYRWLEDLDSDDTRQWIIAQQKLTESYLETLPQRQSLHQRLTQAWDYDKHGMPYRMGNRLFYSKRSGLQNQSVFFSRSLDPDSVEQLLLDANTLSQDGTVSVAGTSTSRDGHYWAYAVSESGSDWNTWSVMDVQNQELLPDTLRWIKFSSLEWAPDNSGFYYARYAEPTPGQELKDSNLNQKLYFHKLGDPQERDQLIYERPDEPNWGFGAEITEDGHYLILHVWSGAGSKNGLFYRDLTQGQDSPFIELFSAFDARYSFLGNKGKTWFLFTDLNAPNKKLVRMDLDHPQPEHWQDLLPEAPTPLQSVSYLKDRLIATYLKDAHNEVRLFDLEGRALGVLDAPALSSISGFYGQSTDDETYYSVSSYTSPGAIYRYQVTENRSSLFWKPDFPVDLSAYQTELHFADSTDGTRVPIFLIRNPNSSPQPQPTILYGYGGFNISLTPSFSPAITIWLEQGGAYAVACLRGGGEYGERWHEGGQKENKQNVFDDCIACAEYLISKKITSPGQLAIKGGSNGGLLVGAVINQRPELFAAAAPAVGVMDMLRFHKFTIGWAWKNEYGDPDSAEDFPNLLRYSPYHNLSAEKDYPATLIQTADHDDRVFPAHSFKYGAALQHAKNRGSKPMLMRIDTKAGHGAGKPTDKIIQSQADEFAFFLHAMQPAPGLK